METELSFERTATTDGIRSAYLKYLADDAIIFRPGPTNGRRFWEKFNDPTALLSRNVTYTDIAANGMLGYSTGNWRLYRKGQSESTAQFGQYVTIWELKEDGAFRATLDMAITHDKLPFSVTDKAPKQDQKSDMNKRGWSPADSSMNFARLGMEPSGLSGAYKQYAADEIRLLRDGDPPIIGKKRVVSATKNYISLRFPDQTASFQSADMAYTWNPCEFANSNEGMEKGNCLNIWKLRDKKWSIVLSVFARTEDPTPPSLKRSDRNTAKQR